MTIRMWIERKKRRVMLVVWLGFALIVAGTLFARMNLLSIELRFAVLPGLSLFILALLHAHFFAFRCPRCDENWAVLAMQGSRSLLGFDQRIRYCPFCGTDIDDELSVEESDATDVV